MIVFLSNFIFLVLVTLLRNCVIIYFPRKARKIYTVEKGGQTYLNKACAEMFIAAELLASPLSVSRQRNATERKKDREEECVAGGFSCATLVCPTGRGQLTFERRKEEK